MADQPYTTREAWHGKHEDGTYVLLRSRRDYPKAGEISALVVTGDLDAARRRLAPLDDAAIERAARAMRAWDGDPSDSRWEDAPAAMRKAWCDLARVALAAAEETGDA